jgi:FkbH-like protein
MKVECPTFWNQKEVNCIESAYKENSLIKVKDALDAIRSLPDDMQGADINIGILRTFTLETMIEYLQLSFSIIPCKPNIFFGDFDNIEQSLLDKDSNFLGQNPDLIFIIWRLEDIHPNLVRDIDSMSLDQRVYECEQLIERVRLLVSEYSENASLFMATFSVPSRWLGVVHDQNRAYGIIDIVSRVNQSIRSYADNKKVKILDLGQWFSVTGQCAIDQKMDLFAMSPIASKYALSFSNFCSKTAKPSILPRYKVLAVDLDNTIWGGVVGEDGLEDLQINDNYPGSIYLQIQRLILSLKHTGVMIVAISKNNLSDVNLVFEHHQNMPIKLEDFTSIRANWKEKHENIISIAEELNLGVDSFVFLDDQKFEQTQVSQALPEVRVLSVDSNPLSIYNSLKSTSYFDTYYVVEEDKVRIKDYRSQIERNKLKGEYSTEDFLHNLEIRASISHLDREMLPRAVQMLSKTNQFNLTTKRHNQETLSNMLNNHSYILLMLSLSDKFGDQGEVGLCIATLNSKQEVLIDSFLLSCRAIGRGAEYALWDALIKSIGTTSCKLKAEYFPTLKNSMTEDFYTTVGMEVESRKDGIIRYSMAMPANSRTPDWIDAKIIK